MKAKRSTSKRVTKKYFDILDRAEVRYLNQNMGLPYRESMVSKAELVSWVFENRERFCEVDVSMLDPEWFRSGILEYLSGLQEFIKTKSDPPVWPPEHGYDDQNSAEDNESSWEEVKQEMKPLEEMVSESVQVADKVQIKEAEVNKPFKGVTVTKANKVPFKRVSGGLGNKKEAVEPSMPVAALHPEILKLQDRLSALENAMVFMINSAILSPPEDAITTLDELPTPSEY